MQDVNWTYIRQDVQEVFWTFYVRSIYVLSPEGSVLRKGLKDILMKNLHTTLYLEIATLK